MQDLVWMSPLLLAQASSPMQEPLAMCPMFLSQALSPLQELFSTYPTELAHASSPLQETNPKPMLVVASVPNMQAPSPLQELAQTRTCRWLAQPHASREAPSGVTQQLALADAQAAVTPAAVPVKQSSEALTDFDAFPKSGDFADLPLSPEAPDLESFASLLLADFEDLRSRVAASSWASGWEASAPNATAVESTTALLRKRPASTS
mmetsp:Transcript_9542/g.25963  ORF Transcript_9542/g.25963 Transcript_9542/m.25963 type:complete len:207 (-) Transcript_9542:582-1202(-)